MTKDASDFESIDLGSVDLSEVALEFAEVEEEAYTKYQQETGGVASDSVIPDTQRVKELLANMPLSEDIIKSMQTYHAGDRNCSSKFAYEFLRDTKQGFMDFGCGYMHSVLQFRSPVTRDFIEYFKRTVAVRISSVRQAAKRQGMTVPTFYAVFVTIEPLQPAPDGRTKYWHLCVARLDQLQYTAYKKEIATRQRNGDGNAELLGKSIGVL